MSSDTSSRKSSWTQSPPFKVTEGITSPKAIIKIPSFEIGKYELRHVIKVPYMLPYYYCVKTKVREKFLGADLEFDSTIGKDTFWGIYCQMPGYKLEVSDKV